MASVTKVVLWAGPQIFEVEAWEVVLVQMMAEVNVVDKTLVDLNRVQVALQVDHRGNQCSFVQSGYTELVLLEEEVQLYIYI